MYESYGLVLVGFNFGYEGCYLCGSFVYGVCLDGSNYKIQRIWWIDVCS